MAGIRALLLAIMITVSMTAESAAQYNDVYPERSPNKPLGTLVPPQLWTAEDVRAYCDSRFRGQERPVKRCMERNQRKIGRAKSLGEVQQLNALGTKSATPAAAPTPTTSPAPATGTAPAASTAAPKTPAKK